MKPLVFDHTKKMHATVLDKPNPPQTSKKVVNRNENYSNVSSAYRAHTLPMPKPTDTPENNAKLPTARLQTMSQFRRQPELLSPTDKSIGKLELRDMVRHSEFFNTRYKPPGPSKEIQDRLDSKMLQEKLTRKEITRAVKRSLKEPLRQTQ